MGASFLGESGVRNSTILIAAVGATLLGATGTAQNLAPWMVQGFERDFATIETWRMEGNCAERDRRLARLRTSLAAIIDQAGRTRPDIKEEYRARLAEAAARRCPAGPAPAASSTTPPIPARVQPPAAQWPSSEFNRLSGEISRACGDEWSVLRLRFLAELDRAIAAEREPVSRAVLIETRQDVLRRDPPPCSKAEATSGIDRIQALNAWQTAGAEIDRELLSAERARFAGSCTERTRHLGMARAALARMRLSGYSPATPGNHAARISEQVARRCTPKRNATTAAALPPGKVPMCKNKDTEIIKSGRAITCRCARVEPYLSVWGSNPYRADSTICNAAVHAGVIPPSGVGVVRLVPVPQSQTALGTTRNGISASNWDYDTANGFTFSAGGSVTD